LAERARQEVVHGDPPRTERPDPVSFFDTVVERSEHAERAAGGPVDHVVAIDGYIIRLRFAGATLAPALTPALTHLETGPGKPDLTVRIWDSASTGVAWPPMPWFRAPGHVDSAGRPIDNDSTPRGDVRGYCTDRIAMHVGDKLFSLLDLERNVAVYWCESLDRLPLWERGAPLRSILHWWLRARGLQLVHAGAVGTPAGAALLAGKGGSGKSTTALTSLNDGLLYLSDDYSLVKLDPTPHVYSLYNTAKVRPDNLERVPHLRDAVVNRDALGSEKALFFVQRQFPDRIVPRLPIRAIMLPRVTGLPDTTIEPASKRESLAALSLSTLHQLAGSGRELLQTIARLVDAVPSHHLNLGTDLTQIPKALASMLDR
jgi:hypothetical protein